MTSIGPADAPRCGWDIRHWALGTSGGNVLYWLLATGLAGWAWYKIGEKEEAIAAEMAAVSISLFDAPKLVAITLTAFFAILAILCLISVVLLASSHPTAQRKRLKGFCIGTLAFAVFVLAWCSAGLILSLGTERKKEIEEACKSIDTKCYSGYLGIVAGSGIVEAIGFLNLGWMLAAIYKYRNHLESGGLDDSLFNRPGKERKQAQPAGDGAGRGARVGRAVAEPVFSTAGGEEREPVREGKERFEGAERVGIVRVFVFGGGGWRREGEV
ncbi:hypothetical protein JCM11251_005113 [Rhodosporidiobolus azoricus]